MATSVPEGVVEYLTTARIGEKGQITVPKQYRESLGLQKRVPFVVLRLGDGLILLPEQQRFEDLCRRISATLAGAGARPGHILATLPGIRKRVFSRHYGGANPAVAAAWTQPAARRRK
jgi:AbrB family looped-hinge helix DNA binding protein